MDDYQKIDLLKTLGVWNSLKHHFEPTLEAYLTHYDFWDDSNIKRCRFVLEFKPSILLRDDSLYGHFISLVFDHIAEIKERATPDLPEKIRMIEDKSADGDM